MIYHSIKPQSLGNWYIEKYKFTDHFQPTAPLYTLNPKDPLGDYLALVNKDRGVIMTNSPKELSQMNDFVDKCEGTILIAGLGLGIILSRILEKTNINDIFVVEIDLDVIHMVSPYFANTKANIIYGDIREIPLYFFPYIDYAWMDIWDTNLSDKLGDRHKCINRWKRQVKVVNAWSQDKIEEI